jgi:Carboxypeptidase regulatory-like domain
MIRRGPPKWAGQSGRATTVTDSTGAVVANAKVTIVNEGTGLTRVVTADSNGEYTAPSLPTGHTPSPRR